ncbi:MULTISPECIES: nucleotide exchange factor GrpE [unclassified Gilliamella]|jgi:molecular chaperone GrpE|uniref:nucleotide exchange factor GrpE n=1 Tax=unclassified Gilliamella TaxID=2685620 RepID=UPI00080EA90E|nr:nucleotide exchange factor GrpE [Gilliamella apicola]OCG33990.1 nucleotide exchange factor GrpE [Gilliamella apicola]OCG42633.1 nucleotide exchange factor GrpE [Gilliamella apicola]OCG48255.1 nucleotide exchange factor GrpE [Gilliamella apicola]OCG66179.1 nucleotide exchange factor GrpE [Gilliamella apicola]OCG72112.1 nucleotide exchange factor GrpE [Gilliamella apicola]
MTEQDKNMSENETNIDTPAEETTEQEAPVQPSLEEQLNAKDARIVELEQALQLAKKNESEAMIRARAEIDNVRKRVEQDVDKARKFALEKFSNELLPVIDNLERALESTDKTNPEHKATVEGLELTLKSFLDTVKKFGIEVINTEDSQLNPDVHQAISMVESPEHQSGQIVNTIQKGYTLNGRLIRPAMVIVAK